ncbi:hypothetical protein TIFTF001_010760 [Ficus carica]|uniref:Uncharacterized protein n=1 Tax=Ficus carica TaxID=3494 RepID=A0AA87ZW08_FICCA|nr:hypothetical protein TIFTF001_010760 [Ficus carica]
MVGDWSHFDANERGVKVPWTDRRTRTSFERDLPRNCSDRAQDHYWVLGAVRFDSVDSSSCSPHDGRSLTQGSAADGGRSFPSTLLLSNTSAKDQVRSMAGDMPRTIGASWSDFRHPGRDNCRTYSRVLTYKKGDSYWPSTELRFDLKSPKIFQNLKVNYEELMFRYSIPRFYAVLDKREFQERLAIVGDFFEFVDVELTKQASLVASRFRG